MAKKKDKISITEFQARGGRSKSPKKVEAVRNNLAKARAVMAERRKLIQAMQKFITVDDAMRKLKEEAK